MSSDDGRRRSRSPPRRRSRSRSRSPRGYRGNRECPSPGRCLGVFGLSLRTTEEDLQKTFGRVAEVDRVNLVMDRRSVSSRGFAFIYFASVGDAERAKEALNGKDLDGRPMRVDFSVTRRAHTPTPGRYMGRRSPARSSRRWSPRRHSRSPPPRRRSRSPPPRYHRRYSPSPPPSSHHRGRSPPPPPSYHRGRSPSPYYRRRSPSPYYARRSPSPHYRGRY